MATRLEPAVVLLVDDEPDLLVTYGRLLRQHGFKVITATGREAALKVIRSSAVPPAVVITELRLADGNGLDVVRAANACEPAPTVIAISRFPSGIERRIALEAGATTYLTKPVSLSTFSLAVTKALGVPSPARDD